MTNEEMLQLAIEISKGKVKENVPKPCPNGAPDPGTFFGAMQALMYLKRIGKI